MSHPSWRELGSLIAAVLIITASTLAYAFGTFALKADVGASLDRIERKLDCMISPKICQR